jgi:hypothetical protein
MWDERVIGDWLFVIGEEEEAASSKGERQRPAGCALHLAGTSSKIYRQAAKVAKERGGEEGLVICDWLLGGRKKKSHLPHYPITNNK